MLTAPTTPPAEPLTLRPTLPMQTVDPRVRRRILGGVLARHGVRELGAYDAEVLESICAVLEGEEVWALAAWITRAGRHKEPAPPVEPGLRAI